MIYKNHKINAEIQTWTIHELNDDGTVGAYLGEGGGDDDYPDYTVWTLDEQGDEQENLGQFDSIANAKAVIDSAVAEAN